MPDIWRIYHVANCRHTTPWKDKLVVIVCRPAKPMGFLINKRINPFIKNNPSLLICQITIRTSDYRCLDRISYINCAQLYPFEETELLEVRDPINSKTKMAIKMAVAASTTVVRCNKKIILDSA